MKRYTGLTSLPTLALLAHIGRNSKLKSDYFSVRHGAETLIVKGSLKLTSPLLYTRMRNYAFNRR